MKRTIFILFFALIGIASYSQSFNEFFTTYKDVFTQTQQQQSYDSGNNGCYNNSVTQYDVIAPNHFMQSIAPQNVQVVNGVYLYNGQFYSVKLKVGVSGTNKIQIVVCGYWNGQSWNNSIHYASSIGYSAPEQIKRACTHEVYISSLGKVYF